MNNAVCSDVLTVEDVAAALTDGDANDDALGDETLDHAPYPDLGSACRLLGDLGDGEWAVVFGEHAEDGTVK